MRNNITGVWFHTEQEIDTKYFRSVLSLNKKIFSTFGALRTYSLWDRQLSSAAPHIFSYQRVGSNSFWNLAGTEGASLCLVGVSFHWIYCSKEKEVIIIHNLGKEPLYLQVLNLLSESEFPSYCKTWPELLPPKKLSSNISTSWEPSSVSFNRVEILYLLLRKAVALKPSSSLAYEENCCSSGSPGNPTRLLDRATLPN